MAATKVAFLLLVLLGITQGMPSNQTRAIRRQLAEMTEKLKYDSNRSLIGFREAVNQLAGAIGRHSQVQKNLDERFNEVLSKVPEQCQHRAQAKLATLKQRTYQLYNDCSSSLIFNAVGDSVDIVNTALKMFQEMFQVIDDIVIGFRNCYSSGVFNSISCTIKELINLGADAKLLISNSTSSVNEIKSLVSNVTNIINVCEGKSVKFADLDAEVLNVCKTDGTNDL